MNMDAILQTAGYRNITAETIKDRIQEKYSDVFKIIQGDVRTRNDTDSERDCFIDKIDYLQNLTNIAPLDSTIQNAYIKLLKIDWPKTFESVKQVTQIKPKDCLAVQKSYFDYLTSITEKNTDYIKQWENLTEIRISNHTIQKAYSGFIQKSHTYGIDLIQKLTGVKPSNDLIQQGYAQYLIEGNLFYLNDLQKVTGAEPSNNLNLLFVDYLMSNK